jgi:hypothetical protein
LPELQAVGSQGGDVAVVLVALGRDPARAGTTARANGVTTLPVLIGDASLRKQLAISEVPVTIVVGPDGRARRTLQGEHDRADFQRALDALAPPG